MTKEEKKLVYFLLLIGSIIFIGIILVPLLLTRDFFEISYMGTGQIGDTIGGITAPFIGGIGVILTFAAFYIQFVANKEQRESLREQQKQLEEQRIQYLQQERDLKIERFENRFFELIRLHRENVSKISVNGDEFESEKAFIEMFREFKICYSYVYREKSRFTNLELTEQDFVNISFILFYVGVNPDSKDILMELLSKYDKDYISYLSTLLITNRKNKVDNQYRLMVPDIHKKMKMVMFFSYKPFEGHMSRMGHYFRHLWMMISYLDRQDESIISEKQKKEYAKMFRAQTSNYEQLILHYNALTDLGKVWFDTGLLKKYKLTKNLPYPKANFGPSIKELYEKGYFEWEEALNND